MSIIHSPESFSTREKFLTGQIRLVILITTLALLTSGALISSTTMQGTRAAATVQNSVPVASVSAASFIGSPATLAPNSIVAAFGTQLSSGVQVATTQPLPTTLLNTTVTIGGVAAPLFFVSPGQINYLIPATVTAGDAQIVVTTAAPNGDQVISRGTVRIAPTAPSIFTANSSGVGAPAAVTGRVNASGQFVFDPNPPFEPDPVSPSRLIPSPIDVGTAAQPAFLILYGTGLQNAPQGSVRAVIGGLEIQVAAVAAPGFVGLDQINVPIPVELKGRGLVDVTLVVNGVSSNTVTVNLAGTPSSVLSINSFSVTDGAIAGQTVSITGNGFSTTTSDNIVRFGSAQARVISASANQLTVIVPFGAQSGRVTIQTSQGETRSTAVFLVKTSLSGIVQSTGTASSNPVPLEGVTVRLVGTNSTARTNRQGAFVMADIPAGSAIVEIDGVTTNSVPPFPSITLKTVVQADRDNQFSQPVSLQQITGGSGAVGSGLSSTRNQKSLIGSRFFEALNNKSGNSLSISKGPLSAKSQVPTANKTITVSDRGITLEVPIGTNVRFPDGKTSGALQLTVVQRSRLPGILLPVGVYSSNIAQITPLGAQFSPGASISFPNPDPTNLQPGGKVDLYRYDFQSGSFIKRGTATVTPDRQRVVSDGRVVDVASFWFVAAPVGVTTVVGRVINDFGFPVSGAQVTVNGRADLTDENGGFAIPDVATAGNAQIQVEAVLPRQWASAPRGVSAATSAVPGGVTNAGTIALSGTGVTGLVLSPFVIDFDSTSPPKKVDVTLTQPAPAGGLNITLASGNPSVATIPASVIIPAGQTTTSFTITRAGSGVAIIGATATFNGNTLETFAVVTVSLPAPVLTAVTPSSAPAGAKITISGDGFSSIPDNNVFGFLRGNNLVWILDPEQNEVLIDATGKVSVRLEVPPIASGAVNIRAAVVNDVTGVISDISAPVNFTVQDTNVPAPVLSGVSPGQGKPRDQVIITGTNFSTVPGDNRVIFRQGLNESEARVLQANATELIVSVPSQDLMRGPAVIIARRIASDGSRSNRSNALDFTLTDDPGEPDKPSLTSVTNVATQVPSGRDGDAIRLLGTGFGLNYYDIENDDIGNDEPLLSILLFYQNNQLVNFSLPVAAQAGTQLTSVVPTGLSAGEAQITVFTFDLETGLLSEESNPVAFNITVGSLPHIDEDEPNDSPETATEVTLPVIVDGDADVDDPAELIIQFEGGATEKLHDLFRLTVDQNTSVTLTLNFTQTGDLDLFVLQEDANGNISILGSSTEEQTTVEQLSGTFPPGEYLIAVGAFSGSSSYELMLTQGTASFNRLKPQSGKAIKRPLMVDRKKQ